MGGWSDQPYIYPACTPLSERRVAYPYSNFNPRASSQAAYQAIHDRNRPRPQQNGPLLKFDQPVSSYMVVDGGNVNYTPAAYEALQAKKRTKPETNGPLINFNQHPDSWMVVNAESTKYKPMPPNTKLKVTAIRWVQFSLRVLEEIGALGVLVLLICFRNMPVVFTWIMRIAPAWDAVVTLYAIYHLIRPARSRTPASSASYHIFALCMDVALLPFYVYICLYVRTNYTEEPGTKGRWHSLFSDADITTKLLLATFLSTIVMSGLHILSAILDLWLIVLFRAIAKLPPDVNPLEDNLTSRASRRNKHKYKNSEATLTESFSEKKAGYLSGSTLSVDQASQLGKDVNEVETRQVPFYQTRVRSTAAVSTYDPQTTRSPRDNFEEVKLYKEPDTQRRSLNDFTSPSRTLDSQLSKHVTSVHPNEVIPWPQGYTERSAGATHEYPAEKKSSFTATASPALPNAASSTAMVKSQQSSGLLNDNWYIMEDNESDIDEADARGLDVELANSTQNHYETHNPSLPQPLKMNPPTPPLKDTEYPDPEMDDFKPQTIKRKPLANRADNGNGDLNRNSTNKTTTSSIYSDDDQHFRSALRPCTPKGKYYGDLAAATRGVLGTKSRPTTSISRAQSNDGSRLTGTAGMSTVDGMGMNSLNSYGNGMPQGHDNPWTGREGNARVISRTGVDIVDHADMNMGSGLRGRRDVSGKVAEEGRAGGGWWSRKVW